MASTDRIVAFCGLVCSDCPAYVATQANDTAALEREAARWREELGIPGVTVQDVTCDGCLDESGRRSSYCGQCTIRACAASKGVPNCAHCPEYACDKLEAFLAEAPSARKVLDAIRATL